MNIKYKDNMGNSELALQLNRKRITIWVTALTVMAAVLVKVVFDFTHTDGVIFVFATLIGMELMRAVDNTYKNASLPTVTLGFIYLLGLHRINPLDGLLVGVASIILGILLQQLLYLTGSAPSYSKAFSVFPYPKSFTIINAKDRSWLNETFTDGENNLKAQSE